MNEYAFPRPLPKGEFPPDDVLRIIKDHAGMTLRDYFAAAALTGILANASYANFAIAAKDAYAIADAMLLKREKK